jgi:hypothetical protein
MNTINIIIFFSYATFLCFSYIELTLNYELMQQACFIACQGIHLIIHNSDVTLRSKSCAGRHAGTPGDRVVLQGL